MIAASAERGFTLIELLVASLVTLSVVGAALALIGPAQTTFQAQPESADEQQRIRIGVDMLSKDLVMAGAGVYAGPASGPLGSFLAPVRPYRAIGESADPPRGVHFRMDAISFIYVPSTSSQTRLAAPLPFDTLGAQLEEAPNCPLPTERTVCGFEAGDHVLLFDSAGNHDVFTVERVTGGMVFLQHRGAPIARYEAGTTVTEVESGTYYLGRDAAGTPQLIRYDGWVTDSPVVDHVVRLAFRYFGDAAPPRRTVTPLDDLSGPWTTYGPSPPPIGLARGSWPPGENCTFAVVEGAHVPRLATLGVGGTLQVELTAGLLSDGPWCPDESSPTRFDADLLRVRRVHVELRVQSALASLRGPASALFVNPGTARAANRYVPDLSMRFDIAPRNMSRGR